MLGQVAVGSYFLFLEEAQRKFIRLFQPRCCRSDFSDYLLTKNLMGGMSIHFKFFGRGQLVDALRLTSSHMDQTF